MGNHKVVVALGGNALLKRSQKQTPAILASNVKRAAKSLAQLADKVDTLIVTHGNGPQIGRLANQSLNYDPDAIEGMDILGAESAGLIGYLIHQELMNALGPDSQVATLLTRVEVDREDPAFGEKSKQIGPVLPYEEIAVLSERYGWTIGQDGDGYRRLVASPAPQRIVDLGAIKTLGNSGYIVICCGGGGIPVCTDASGNYQGTEAVIDKDQSSSLLASELGATALLLLTDVPGVYSDWQGKDQRLIHELSLATDDVSRFAAGTMRPKLLAARTFSKATGGFAAIGSLEEGCQILNGEAGTRILC